MTTQESQSAIKTPPANAPGWRRTPLVFALFGLLFVQVLLAIGLTTALGALNLRHGFQGYLVARDAEMLDGFVEIAARRITAAGGLEAFTTAEGSMRGVLDELALERGVLGGPPPPPPPSQARAAPGEAGSPLRPPRRGSPDSFGARVALFSMDGRQIDGFAMPAGVRTIARPVIIDGVAVAQARVSLIAVPDGVEASFLRGQLSAVLATALTLLLLAAAASWFVAQRWARPLHALQVATSRIAKGEFSVRMPVAGLKEIAATTDNINHMADALERLENARRVWLAEISHELRTPVTIMRGELESIIDGVRAPSPEAVVSLHEEVLALTRLIDDLHLITLGDTGRLPCTFERVALRPLLEAACRRFAPQAAAKGLALRADEASLQDVEVTTDPMRLGQVLANVLSNAVSYTAAPGRIQVSLRAAKEHVEIRIEDTPPAVPDEALEAMFESFRRLDPSRNRDSGGSGLGLAVSRSIVEALGGRIAASHSQMGGVCIAIALPTTEVLP